MISFDFQTQTYAKWILTGEHAVLRGHPALVFPIHAKTLTLSYQASSAQLEATFDGPYQKTLHLLFWSVLEHGLQLTHRSLHQVSGCFHLTSLIPIGVGMGASAALCVAVARWFLYQGWISTAQCFDFARQLEDLFHGKSSGLDIVGVSEESGQFFQEGQYEKLHAQWQPICYLTSCEQQGITSQCIATVHALWQKDPAYAARVDQQMADSAKQARDALALPADQGWQGLVDSVKQANTCFQQWGLVSETLQSHMNRLLAAGAAAVKPTGSGGGGYVLSLWKKPPAPDTWIKEWIAV